MQLYTRTVVFNPKETKWGGGHEGAFAPPSQRLCHLTCPPSQKGKMAKSAIFGNFWFLPPLIHILPPRCPPSTHTHKFWCCHWRRLKTYRTTFLHSLFCVNVYMCLRSRQVCNPGHRLCMQNYALKGHWTTSASSPNFFQKSWDFYIIRSVYLCSDCMLNLTCSFNSVTKIYAFFFQ